MEKQRLFLIHRSVFPDSLYPREVLYVAIWRLRAMIHVIFISIYTVNGDGSAKEKSLSAVAISLTRQLGQECGIESLRKL